QGTPVAASTSTWTGTNSSDWGDANNWSPAGVPAATTAVIFGSTGARASVDLGTSNRTVASVNFQGTVGTTIGSSGQTLTLDSGASTFPFAATGTNSITCPVVLNSSIAFNVTTGAQMTLGGIISE